MHYVIGDVHGCYDELMDLINTIERRDSEAKFILVGDLIDRGPKVGHVLEWAMKNITLDGKYQCLKGNHEILAIKWYYDSYLPWYKNKKWWKKKAGYPMSDFDFSDEMRFSDRKKPEDIEPLIKFFEGLPFDRKIEVDGVNSTKVIYRIVHAWYLYGEKNVEKQHYNNVWNRTGIHNELSEEIIVHGHTPNLSLDRGNDPEATNPPGLIAYYKNAINVDGGCCYGGDFVFPYACMLCALCLETLEEIYPYSLAERFMQISKTRISIDEANADESIYKKEYLSSENKYRRDILNRLGG